MTRKTLLAALAVAAALGGTLYVTGFDPSAMLARFEAKKAAKEAAKKRVTPAPAVSAVKVETADFAETVLVTGTLVARELVSVATEVDSFRILEVLADEAQRVEKGQVLARLERETLAAQMAQNAAQAARSAAAIEQARSSIAQAEARLVEARSAYNRAKPLRQSGAISESVYEQREAAARTAEAQLAAARDGLKVAEADERQVAAQARELAFKLERTEIKAPAAGLISRRNARIGAMATGQGDPLFRIIADGEFELEAEVIETRIGKLKPGQKVAVEVTGVGEIAGTIRLVSPEVDRTSRLGQVRILLGADPRLKLGLFARGSVATASSRGLAVPASALSVGPDGATVQVVVADRVETRRVETGLVAGGLVEVRTGLKAGETVVARAGSFLRDGDVVRPVLPEPKVSEAGQ